jgi:myo-inositol-1-phosphate synthase
MSGPRIGIWLIGAKGGVAATALVGLAAMRRGLVDATGLVTALPPFSELDLAGWDQFVVGGHEIRDVRLTDEALRLATESHAVERDLVVGVSEDLAQIDARIRPGILHRVGSTIEQLADLPIPRDESPRQAIQRVRNDFSAFIAEHQLQHLVVVNVSSTEPAVDPAQVPATWDEVDALLDDPRRCPLPASSLYAAAALDLGCSYLNFTPSLGSAPAALDELARRRGTRHMGCDGKTGETLLKSVLAPMFQRRHLRVLSWVGHNIFGNMDGRVLNDPTNKQTKIASKSHLVNEILGYAPQTHVSIEYIESMGDWKTAWDHIHFAGFLGTRMTMQFIWQGSDSLLAAPLVLDLIRFTELAWRRGDTGQLRFLASFFKSPYGVAEHCFDRQFQMLEQWASTAPRVG